MMSRNKHSDPRCHSRSPKSTNKSVSLNRNSTDKDLRKDYSFKSIPINPAKVLPTPVKLISTNSQKTLVQGVSSLTPKYKGIVKSSKEMLLEKPKITKKKKENLTQLQEKLKSLEDKLEKLKVNISKSDDQLKRSHTKTKTKSKSKSNKSQSVKSKKGNNLRLNPTEEEEKNDGPVSSPKSQPFNSYVTRVLPIKKPKQLKESPKSPKMEELIGYPYYVGHVITSYDKEDDHPFRQHLIQSISTASYLKKLSCPSQQEIEHLKIKVKANLKNPSIKTIVLDLDQTLIHCNDTEDISDFKVPITFPNGEIIEAGVNIRPYAKELLKNLSKHFELIVFTASHECYANVVLDCLDPQRILITQRVFRQQCFQTQQGMYIKDLRIFSNRDMKKMVLVDNAAHSYHFQMEQGIPILPFYFNKKDSQLKSLERFLMEEILPAEDVRPVIRRAFKLDRYVEFNSVNRLVEKLYMDK